MNLYSQTLGAGPDLVLLHGWGFNSTVWQPIIAKLSEHFCLHLIDLPGHGDSLRQIGESQTSLKDAQQWVTLIAQHTPPRAHFLGWSLGATIAMKLALQHPERIDKLILVSSTPCFINNSHWQFGVEKRVLQDFANDLNQNYIATLKRFFTLQCLDNPCGHSAIKILIKQFSANTSPDHDALQAGLRLLEETDLTQYCADLKQACLLIHSEDDKLVPVAAGHYLQEKLSHAKLVLLNQTGHIPFIIQPDVFCHEVSSFIHG